MTDKLYVEVGFDANALDQFPTWYDVSPYVISGQTKRGRSYEIDRIETGTASFTLDNPDGRFTPGRASITALTEYFNNTGYSGSGVKFTVDSGPWLIGGTTGDLGFTPGPDGLTVSSTVNDGQYLSLDMDVTNRMVAVTPGAVVTVTYKAKATNAAEAANVSAVIELNGPDGSNISTIADIIVSSNGQWVIQKATFTVPAGVTWIRPSFQASPVAGTGGTPLTLTLGYVKVTVPSPYNGKVEPSKPIRSYIVTDDNWLPFQAVRANSADADGVRWHQPSSPVGGQLVATEPALDNREVFHMDGASPRQFIAGYAQDSDYIQVKTGQVVNVAGLLANVDTSQTGPDSRLCIDYSADGVNFTTKATSTPVTDIGVYYQKSVTWNADVAGYIRVGVTSVSATGGCRIRITDLKATVDNIGDPTVVGAVSGRYPEFRGTVERWVQEYHGKQSTVSVDCVDGMALISQGIKTRYRNGVKDWYSRNVKGTAFDGGFMYWPCVESENPTSTLADLGGPGLHRWTGTLPGSGSATFTTTKTMMYADGEESGGYSVVVDDTITPPSVYPGVGLYACTDYRPQLRQWQSSLDVDFWFMPLSAAAGTTKLFEASPSYDKTAPTYISYDSNGSMTFRYSADPSINVQTTAGAGNVSPGLLIHVGMRVSIDTTAKTATIYGYINGVQKGSQTVSVASLSNPGIPRFERVFFGQDAGIYGDQNYDRLNFSAPARGTINHIVFTLGSPAGLHSALQGHGSENAESETVRLNRVLDSIGWNAPRKFDNPLSSLLSGRWPMEADAMDVLSDAAESADGTVFVSPAGSIVYQNRYRRMGSAVRWTAFEWADGLRFTSDDSRVRNEIKVARSSGLFRIARDDASIDKHGRKSLSVTKNVVSDTEIADAAAWKLRRYKDAYPWCDTLKVEAHTLNSDTDATLKGLAYAADVSHRLKLTDLPPTAPADECDFFIEGIETSFAVNGGILEWDTVLTVSDASNSSAWVLEDSVSGLLDSDYCVATY